MATLNMPAPQTTDAHQKSLGELFTDLTRDTATLVRQEVALATAEITHKASKAGQDIGKIAVGGALAYAGLIVVLIGIAIALAAAGMATWLAYLLVGVIVLAVGGFIAFQGLTALKSTDLVPRQTVETLKDDAKWVKEQAKP